MGMTNMVPDAGTTDAIRDETIAGALSQSSGTSRQITALFAPREESSIPLYLRLGR
jgi:hypothetical protein